MINKTFGNLKLKSSSYRRNDGYYISKYLKIDLFNSIAEDFTNSKYIPKLHMEDIFLFLDEEGHLVGVLKGKKWDKNFDNLNIYVPYGLRKNWNSFSEISKTIIRVPKEELKYRERYNKVYSPVKELDSKYYKISLKNRLQEYKESKYENMTIEELEEKCLKISSIASRLMFLKSINFNDLEILEDEIHKVGLSNFSNNPGTIMSKLGDKMEHLWNLKRKILEYENNLNILKNNSKDKEHDEYYTNLIKYATKEYNEYLAEVKTFVAELEKLTTKLEKMFL